MRAVTSWQIFAINAQQLGAPLQSVGPAAEPAPGAIVKLNPVFTGATDRPRSALMNALGLPVGGVPSTMNVGA